MKAISYFELIIQREKDLRELSLSSPNSDYTAMQPGDLFSKLSSNRHLSYHSLPTITTALLTGDPKHVMLYGLIEASYTCVYNNTNDNLIMNDIEASNSNNETLFNTAVNNFSICCLHLKNIKKAVAELESLIQLSPTHYCLDPIIFNLCTMYDLTCAPEIASYKKKALQMVANKYYIDDPMPHWRCFRISTSN